jgi:hypothetical protein
MKKSIFILICASVLLISCKKSLLDSPPEILVPENLIFREINYVTEFVTDIYGGTLQSGFSTTNSTTFIEAATDDAKLSNLSAEVQRFGTGAWNADNNPDNVWGLYYIGIRKCNKFFEQVDQVNTTDHGAPIIINNITAEVQKQRLIGEVFFLRAYFYTELIKRYGGVPLLTSTINSGKDANTPRATYDDCVKLILKDCDSAFNRLPVDYTASNVQNYFGRATKWAAQALKARVLLYAASPLNNPSNDLVKWEAAAAASLPFTNGTTSFVLTSITNNMANYEANFRGNPYANKEMIWVLNEANQNYLELRNYAVGFDRGSGGIAPSQNLVDAFEMKTTGKPISDPTSGYNPLQPYLNRDPRLDASILRHGLSYNGRVIDVTRGGIDGPDKTNGTVTGYYLKKFLDPTLNLTNSQTSRHFWIFFRLPEMLLNYAEARNEAVGADLSVYTAVNMIRTRVGMPVLPIGLSQVQMRERIRNERRVELAFEGHRPWDVRRWKIGENTLGSPLQGIKVSQEGASIIYTPFVVENKVFQPKMYLYPIPQNELDANSAIGRQNQNSGW